MRTTSFFFAALTAVALTPAVGGCSLVVDLERFHEKAPLVTQGANGEYQSLKLSLVAMKPHIGHMFEYRVVDANNMVQSRGVIKPLGPNDITVDVPLAVPKTNGPYRLDFYADVNNSGGYDGLGSVITNDHAWRIDPLADYPAGSVAPIDGVIQVTFTHNTSFTDIDQYPSGTPNKSKDTGLGAKVHVTGADTLHGKLLQIRVAETTTKHVVALYRINAMDAPAFDIAVPGCVDTGVDYNVDVYVDANGNGVYDDPSTGAGDLGWRIPVTSDAAGLAATIDATTTATANVDVGAP